MRVKISKFSASKRIHELYHKKSNNIAPSIPPVTWFKDLDPDNVNGNLEFSYYVKNNFS